MGYRLGIDVGGTFTDLVLFSEVAGTLVVEKVPSVPSDPSEGIMDGISKILARAGVAPSDVSYVAHGTTVATNTLLQRHGARTALITTRGFRDLLEIARQRRPSLYDLDVPKPRVLVRRKLRREVPERITADGRVRVPLDLDAVDRVLDELAGESIEALAVCFLYSFLHPEHERAVAERARRRLPGVAVSASFEVLPELREYERLSTTVANAYLLPRMSSYVQSFSRRVQDAGIPCSPYINQSNGGTISIDEAARAPVRIVLSGPSAGVMGAVWLARHRAISSLVTFDMGGTSTDVSFVKDGAPTLAFEREIDGIPLRVAGLDIETIGAGGGSIGWRDSGSALRVGPESAGARPGPACYGRGGAAATVTDANLFLGRLGPSGLLGGSMPLDVGAAASAIGTLAEALALSPLETARGIIAVVNANMAGAVRLVTVQRGVDPAGLALLAFGGAGPLHAGALARELGIRTVVVPPNPGLLCALGLLVEDLRVDAVRTCVSRLETDALERLDKLFSEMEADATAWLEREQVPPARRSLERWLDMRYLGQNYELLVPAPEEAWRAPRSLEPLRDRFLALHEAAYGYAAPDEPIQIVNARLVARGRPDPPALPRTDRAASDVTEAISARRGVFFETAADFVDCPVYDRRRLAAGHVVTGPAVIEQFDSTTLIHPGQRVEVDDLGFLLIRS
ncbi:MAG TPA: hydantoinase/oxoprolinase family protein [Candidatus Methylomirabilis sp.]|nr:hydantoinase/oxoprolinase family protein [Candidatus Methylomirabilis sp.]